MGIAEELENQTIATIKKQSGSRHPFILERKLSLATIWTKGAYRMLFSLSSSSCYSPFAQGDQHHLFSNSANHSHELMFRVGSVVPRRINASQSTASQTLAGDLYNPVIQYTENVLSADFIDAYLSLASNILRILPNDKRLLALWKSGINPKAVISSYIDMNSQDSDSFGEYSSLATDPHVKKLSSGATLAYATEEYTNYGFIALLGLAQRFHVDFLPIVWQEPRGKIGRGGQASINQATLDLQISLAFKQFAQREVDDPFKEIVRELIMLTHPSVQDHRFIVQLEGICWDIVEDKVWPVLVFQKTSLGDLEDFANSDTGRNLSVEQKRGICADIGTAIRDMHANSKAEDTLA